MDNVRKPRIILRRIRGGRKCGSGSGSTIWERHKRNGIQLKTISKRTIRLRSGIRFEINAVSHSFKSFQQIVPSHRRHPHPPRRMRLRYLRSDVFGRFTLSRLPGKSRFYYRFISSCGPTALCPRITFSISFRSDDGRSPGIVFFTALVALPISRAL